MRWRITPGRRFRRIRPWTSRCGEIPLLRVGDQSIAVVADEAGEPRAGRAEVSGEFTARPGRDALLALAAADRSPLAVPAPGDVRARLRATGDAWRRWCGTASYDGPSRDLVLRSAMMLKLLTYAPTGALMAAGTTSLPETIGGERNFDYRYGWIRDTSFALEALIRLGLRHEIHDTLSWMLDAIGRNGTDIPPFYGLRGDVPNERREVPLRGYRDSQPVLEGNEAVSQSQWGSYGDLLESVWLAVDQAGVILDPGTARLLEDMAGQVCDVWAEPDSGIWELDATRHYTISKIGCWAALDRTIRLAERGQLAARDVGRWRAEAAAIREWTDEHCWSPAKRSYTFYAGSDDLDAAVLLAGRTGYLAGEDPRFAQTIDAVRRELADGPAVYRYTGSREQEGAFVPCSFWLVDALTRAGRHEQARELWDGITALAPNDLGLLSEELEPGSGSLLGNMPQALSHLALISAAVRLAD
jgi:GH15 family glucan-1,4-alpha-glucosidase